MGFLSVGKIFYDTLADKTGIRTSGDTTFGFAEKVKGELCMQVLGEGCMQGHGAKDVGRSGHFT
jgi:hypothetical protein